MKYAYLVMVVPASASECQKKGNNKFYRMEELGNGFFRATYGRIGTSGQTREYPMSKWYDTFSSKINKGYTDNTELTMSPIVTQAQTAQAQFKQIRLKSVRDLIDRLMGASVKVVQQNYRNADVVTMAMVNKAQEIIDVMTRSLTVKQFNTELIELMTVIPRTMSRVDDYLATVPTDMQKICIREQSLLDSLRSKVATAVVDKDTAQNNKQDITILEAFGLKVTKATAEDIKIIEEKLGGSVSMFKKAWRVTNQATENAFQEYMKTKAGTGRRTELLWHGSSTGNWWGIMQEGLKIRRGNAVAHGTMFGHGIYFAPKAKKSIGYTSLMGSYWNHGREKSGFIALFEVGVGNPYYTKSAKPDMTYEELCRYGEDSLWAKEGHSLRNDEVIVYQEKQATIRYIVEIG